MLTRYNTKECSAIVVIIQDELIEAVGPERSPLSVNFYDYVFFRCRRLPANVENVGRLQTFGNAILVQAWCAGRFVKERVFFYFFQLGLGCCTVPGGQHETQERDRGGP